MFSSSRKQGWLLAWQPRYAAGWAGTTA